MEEEEIDNSIKLPISPKYQAPTKIADISKIVNDYLKHHGIPNKMQSKYIALIAKYMIKNKNEHFPTMIAKPKVGKSEAWQQAYEFIYEYFSKNQLKFTLETLKYELKDVELPNISGIISGLDPENGLTEYFESLIKSSQHLAQMEIEEKAKLFRP